MKCLQLRTVHTLLFAALTLAPLLEAQGWTAPGFCHGYNCPQFTAVQINQDTEERAYTASRWITTKVPSAETEDVKAGNYKLYNYFKGDNEEGTDVPMNTWPVLVTMTVGEDGSESNVSVSWFVSADTVLPKPTDPSVTEELRPAATVYVRTFSGFVSHALGQDNAKQLREALVQAGKSFEPHRYTGAVYDSPWDIIHTHHNEIWVYAA
ncbi:heme-binding protein soul2 [Centroberyx gerrardi]|uniref:heme-binding protein soul2 n=1 Tax=Centroberyx gerrardi TaxID=166262 RepID=UPI003AB0E3D3